jgi:hypothetical protein
MIDVSEVVNDPENAQSYSILRSAGTWVNGVWQPNAETLQGYGRISVARPRDVEMIPEGDKIVGAMVFWSSTAIFGTRADSAGNGGSSDILMWRGKKFRVLSVYQYSDYGYWKAIATRMEAA